MGSESSVMERQEGDGNGSDRARSSSPLPRYNNLKDEDNDGLDLPKFASTQPAPKAERADSPERRPHAVSEPDYPDREGEKVHRKKKKKKKRKRQSLGTDEVAEGEGDSQEHVPATAPEPEDEEHTEQRSPKKKKRKRRRSNSSQQLPGEEDADQVLELRSPLPVIASSPPAWRSNREKKGRKNKRAQEDEVETAAVEPSNEDNAVSGDEEVIPSTNARTPGKSPGKRARRSSSSSKTSKRQRLASPFGIEGIASQSQEFEPPESPTPVAGRRKNNAQIAVIAEEEEESQPTRPPGPSQWTQSSSYQWPPIDDTPKAGPESDDEAPSRSEEQELPRARPDEAIDTAAGDVTPKAGPEDDANAPQSAQDLSHYDLMEVDGLPRLDLDRDEIESATSGDEVVHPRSKDLEIDSESEAGNDSEEDAEGPVVSQSPEEEDQEDAEVPVASPPPEGGEDEDPEVVAHPPGEGGGEDPEVAEHSPEEEEDEDPEVAEPSPEQEENMVTSTHQSALTNGKGNTRRRRARTPSDQPSEDEAETASRASEDAEEMRHDEEAEGGDDEDANPKPTTQTTPTRHRRKRPKDIYEVQGSPPKIARGKPANEEAPAASSPPKSSARAPGSRKSTKRKVKTPYFARDDDDENAAAFAELPGDDAVERPKKKRKALSAEPKKRKARSADAEEEDPPLLNGRYRTGPLTAREQKQVRDAVEAFRESESLPREELVRVIHTNPQQAKGRIYGELWSSVVEACPTRKRQKLITWCRQNYHNFVARGTWTKEQDDELMDMIERHGKKWAHIGGLINRLPMDCRDRYRNHLVCRDTVKLDYWSKDEEEKLYEAVQIAAKRIREDKTLAKADDETIESMINWQLISEAMGQTRNRLQCMKKWKQLGEKELIPEQLSAVLPPDSSFRLSMTRKDLKKIDARDKYQLVRFIRDTKAKTDSGIKWKDLVSNVFEDKYERKALTVTWARLRDTVPEATDKTAQECAEYLCDVFEAEGSFGDAVAESGPNSAVTSRKSSPLKSARSLSPASAAARLKARGYRKARTGPMTGRGSRGGSIAGTSAPGTPAGRLSEQAMARSFQGRKRSGVASRSKDEETEVIEDSAAEETQEQEVPEEEASEEEDIDAPPREPTPSSDEEPAPTPVPRQREPSIDLGVDSDNPTGTPLRTSPKQQRSTPRTYSARGKAQSVRESTAQNTKILKDRRSVIPSSQHAEPEAESSTPRRLKKVRLSSRNGHEVLRALPDQDGEDENLAGSLQRNGSGPRKMAANGAELPSATKRTKEAPTAPSPEPAVSGWKAINSTAANGSSKVPVFSQPGNVSDISSDMDDMEDIPARLPGTQLEEEYDD
ncbi:hypothetical protein QBC34DRAFT_408822 [Podospora aff. communis PSN243]|uniref:DNA-binding protein n=1 Tax=Podospora aff. communis PSN243 TaxID=3040156 RepID=A0AAV9GIE2_9PEZI|nr:hypothetical protein QBC34DRAFT_408822 [Podospora aff. communis PSN243]